MAAFEYMPSVHQAVLFGGHDASSNLLNDTWVRQSGCWTQLHPAQSPPANTIVASAYDANSGSFVVLVYGASGGSTHLDLTTWLWDGQNWQQASGVSPRVSAGQAAFDRASGRVILFAMADAGGAPETWAWDGLTWSLLSPVTSPIARFNAAMVTDPASSKILLFGGVGGATGEVLGDSWTWGGSQWAKLAPKASPPPRQEATAAPFTSQGKSIMLGGLGSSGVVLDDAWQWDGITWSSIPSFGANCCSVAIDDGTEVVVFGGGSDRATNQTRIWNGTSWTTA
ncbi:MAG: kelch repeat-containing protein [Candidatus Dormibacteraeota bacterium]|nr:kelch repeat-containing protein [Candidatus Dormibacteraeota bacterium]